MSYEYNDSYDWEELIDTLNNQVSKIADLEAKLAESESKVAVGRFWHSAYEGKQLDYDKLNNDYNKQEKLLSEVLADKSKLQFEFDQLKQQLAEKEKEIDEVRSNHANLVADIAYKSVNVYTAESKKTGVPTFYKIHYSQLLEIEDMENLRNYAQDKISFALEQLEKVKEQLRQDVNITAPISELKKLKDYLISVDDFIDNQIKAIKGGK